MKYFWLIFIVSVCHLDGVPALDGLLGRGEEGVWVVDLRHEERHPARRGEAGALQPIRGEHGVT